VCLGSNADADAAWRPRGAAAPSTNTLQAASPTLHDRGKGAFLLKGSSEVAATSQEG
jgi:hypothetical protein